MKPHQIKEIAKKFISEYYPKYLKTFDELWGVFKEFDFNMITSGKDIQSRLGEGLSLAGQSSLEFKEMMAGNTILYLALAETKGKENISEDDLLKCIETICTKKLININPNLKEKVISSVNYLYSKEEQTALTSQGLIFFRKYKVMPISYPDGRGLLKINNYEIELSQVRYDLIKVMIDKLFDDWLLQDLIDTGWVPYEEFERSVKKWKKDNKMKPPPEQQTGADSQKIIREVNRINKQIADVLGLKEETDYLVENGKSCGWSKHFRFRVHPEDIDRRNS